ncbi:nitrile hydratase accessory protein [Cupriavidus basilensis]
MPSPLALALHERGAFTWTEWAASLSQVIRDAQTAGDPDTGEHYYRFWLTALERISAAKGLVDQATLLERRDAWVAAARRTPHGQPDRAEAEAVPGSLAWTALCLFRARRVAWGRLAGREVQGGLPGGQAWRLQAPNPVPNHAPPAIRPRSCYRSGLDAAKAPRCRAAKAGAKLRLTLD